MKWITLFTFLINNIFFVNISYAQLASQEITESDFDQKTNELYQSLGIDSIVPKEAFVEGYTTYLDFLKKGKIANSQYLTFVNFSIPAINPRFIIVDLKNRSVYDKLPPVRVSHGMRSGEKGGPAVSFSNDHKSHQSSLGFYITGETYQGGHGLSLKLDGVSSGLNTAARPRLVVIHAADYVDEGGRSQGCLALNEDSKTIVVPLLAGKKLIYAFESNNLPKLGDKQSAIEAIKTKTAETFETPADVSNVKRETEKFEDLEIAKAKPSNGGLLMGLVGIGGAFAIASKKDLDKNQPALAQVETLGGSAHYQKCQNLSDSSWAQTSQDINAGGNPSEHFRGSWAELRATAKLEELDNSDVVAKAQERTAEINECVATAYISTRTDFTKSNINQPDMQKSLDGSITCKYEGAESQDYQPCLDTIAAYDKLRQDELTAHNKQAADYQNSAQIRVGLVNGDSAQAQALAQASGLQADHSNIALKRAEISSSNIDQLSAIASKIPTTDSLYDECKAKFARHGTVSANEFSEFSKAYFKAPQTYSAERDYCLEAVTKAKPLNNQEAREQVKAVLKKLGHEMQEYTSKSEALKNRSAMTPTMDSNTFTRNLTDIKFNEIGNGSPVKGYGRDGSLLLQNNGSGSSSAAGSFGSGGAINGQGSNAVGVYRRAPGINGASAYSTSGGYGSMGSSGSQDLNRAAGSGIYDDEFHRKINAALQSPEKVAELNLSPEQMKEYIARRDYNQLMAQGSSNAGRDPASTAGDVKDERPVDISAKEMNIFDIISSRYAKEFSEDL
jgi:hypothetical protein